MESILKTKLGKFYIKYSDKGLSLLSFTIPPGVKFVRDESSFAKNLTNELNDYADGKLKEFTIALDIQGTEFQKEVWRELTRIKYGEVKSYGEIAKVIDKSGGQRAVGGANNKNKIPILIPCHRVIRADGTLGGYAGGVELKERLLEIEGVAIKI